MNAGYSTRNAKNAVGHVTDTGATQDLMIITTVYGSASDDKPLYATCINRIQLFCVAIRGLSYAGETGGTGWGVFCCRAWVVGG